MVGIWEHGFWVVPIGVYHALKVFFRALFFAVGVTSGHLWAATRSLSPYKTTITKKGRFIMMDVVEEIIEEMSNPEVSIEPTVIIKTETSDE